MRSVDIGRIRYPLFKIRFPDAYGQWSSNCWDCRRFEYPLFEVRTASRPSWRRPWCSRYRKYKRFRGHVFPGSLFLCVDLEWFWYCICWWLILSSLFVYSCRILKFMLFFLCRFFFFVCVGVFSSSVFSFIWLIYSSCFFVVFDTRYFVIMTPPPPIALCKLLRAHARYCVLLCNHGVRFSRLNT